MTVDIPDEAYELSKARAVTETTTPEALVLRGVELVLPKRKPLKLPFVESSQPGTLDITNEQIYDLIDFPWLAASLKRNRAVLLRARL